jgi:hypothetical protein
MGIELICSQLVHLGFCFAACGVLLRYKQYPTALIAGSGEGGFAFHERTTRWWPVFCGEDCSAGRPAGGQVGEPGWPSPRGVLFVLAILASCGFSPDPLLTRLITPLPRNPYTVMSTATPSASR